MRAFLKLGYEVHGIVVNQPFNSYPAYPLKKWDVISKIGDTPIDDQGMISLGDNVRVYFSYMAQKLAKDGNVPLTIIRGGKEMQISLQTFPDTSLRCARVCAGNYPSYFIYGPLVFSNATYEIINGYLKYGTDGRTAATFAFRGSPLLSRLGDKPAFDGERLVVASSPFLTNKIADGYSSPMSHVVTSVNGIPIKNLEHLVAILRDSKDEFITIEFADHYTETLVFPRDKMSAVTEDILNNNGIRNQGSPDVLPIWNAKPTH